MILLGNKCDLLHERQVPSNEIEKFVQMSSIKYFEGSAKERINVDQSFYDVVRLIRAEKNKCSPSASIKKKKTKCCIM